MTDVHSVLASTALLSPWGLMPLASFRESTHLIFHLPVFMLPSIFPSITIFSRESCFLIQQGSSFMCSGTHLFIFLVDQGILELSSKTVFQMNRGVFFFSYQPYSLSNGCSCSLLRSICVKFINSHNDHQRALATQYIQSH